MKDEKKSSKKTWPATFAGIVTGGAVTGALTYKAHSDQLIKDICNENSPRQKLYETAVECRKDYNLHKDAYENGLIGPKELLPYNQYATEVVERHTALMKDKTELLQKAKTTEATKTSDAETQRSLRESKTALRKLRTKGEEVFQVEFHEGSGAPATKIIMRDMEKGGAGESFMLAGIGKPEGMTVIASATNKGVFVMNPEEIEALHKTEWFKQAKKTLEAAEKTLGKDDPNLLRKAAPTGWAWKHLDNAEQAAVIGATTIGAVILGLAAHAFGRHLDAKSEHKQLQAEYADSPFAQR